MTDEQPKKKRNYVRGDAATRFWPKVDKGDGTGCWLWTAGCMGEGYGSFTAVTTLAAKKHVLAHRWAYEQLVGPIPDGMVLDHIVCDTPTCVRPDHLVPTTSVENAQRGLRLEMERRGALYPCGHERGDANSYYLKRDNGTLVAYCRACQLERVRRRKRSRAAA